MKTPFFILGISLLLISSCSKKSADTPAVMIPERIVISPESKSVVTGDTAMFSIMYYNTLGAEAAAPPGITWASSDASIATVNQGIANGVSAGQVEIKATYKNSIAKTLLTVVAGNTQTATVEIEQKVVELKLNESFTLTALAKDVNGNTVAGKIFSWETDSAEYATINAATGEAMAKGYGTANITVSADGIKSSPAMVQVIRIGNFSQMASTGAAKLKIENGILKLQTSTDFSVSAGPPDLRIYLGNSNNNINNALEIASLNDRKGMQSWNIAGIVNITQYRYVIVWCKQFGGVYGVADFGN
jgi:uncharacterized protein YjdB